MNRKALGIAEIRRMLQSRECSCVELTNAYLSAIDKENDTLNAYVLVTAQTALQAAQETDDRLSKGLPLRPLEGVPMTLKDNISTKGIATTCCSKMLEGYIPIYDATVWETLKSLGAVLLGKTNMDEFAMGSSCETSCHGGAKNPHNVNHVSGGSSGGAACAVAAGLACYGIGSDTGGSIRQPASFCGVVGLKPTYGAVSRYGLIAYASGFDQIGPIASSAADAAEILDAISGYDPLDSTSTGLKGVKTACALGKPIKGLRIGIAREYFEGVNEDIAEAINQAVGVYRALGAEIAEVSLPCLRYALPVYYILACAQASSNLGRYDGIRYGYRASRYTGIDDMICKTRSEGFGPEVKRRIMLGTYVLSAGYYDAYYKKAERLRGAVIRGFDEVFSSCDLLLTPTVPSTAFETGKATADPVETYLTDICTVPVNIAGLPALSLPCGKDRSGLPIGMQLIGPAYSEGRMLCAADAYERETRGEGGTNR